MFDTLLFIKFYINYRYDARERESYLFTWDLQEFPEYLFSIECTGGCIKSREKYFRSNIRGKYNFSHVLENIRNINNVRRSSEDDD
jgi:hypothetical protein